MKNIVRFFLCILILGAGVGITYKMISSKKPPERRPVPPTETHVEAMRVKPVDYQVTIRTQGEVQPRTETTLIPQVAGAITEVAPGFRDGGYFEQGDILLQIEPTDYATGVTIAEASVARATLQIEQEQARAEQAKRDWDRLGKEGKPSSLLLREPQVKEAVAALSSAEAQLEKARRDLERTAIRAPYAGRVLEAMVDVGQYVSPGTRLGRIYAIDYVEIPLPLSDRQIAFVNLPEAYRGEKNQPPKTQVNIKLKQGGRDWSFPGQLVRTSGAVDTRSRQTAVVAQVDDPYARKGDRPPLKVGMFVQAEIAGKRLPGSVVIPQLALREGRYVLVIDDENRLHRVPVEVRWSEKDQVVIGSGIQPGDVVCLTPVAYAVTGAQVIPTIDGEVRRVMGQEVRRKGPPGGGAGKSGAGKGGALNSGAAKGKPEGARGKGPAKQP